MAATEQLRFTRVALVNWRNFRHAEARLGARAFIIGPNASGKSNFLDALRFLRDLARPTGGGLAAAIAARESFSTIRCLHARDPSDVVLDVEVGSTTKPDAWRYRLRLQRRKGERQATVSEERVYRNGREIENLLRPPDASDPLIYSQTKLEQVAQNRKFRELADFFASIRYLHVVPQIVRDPRRHLALGDDPYGGDLLRRIKDVPKKTREPRLRRIAEALRVAVPQFVSLELKDDADGHPHLEAAFAHWRANAARQQEDQFSDGTLRLIGFLWSLTERGGPLLLEEPELSLNDAIVEKLPEMMRRAQRFSGRQVIATTHSYAILNAPGVGLSDVHRLHVGTDGSVILTASDDLEVVAQVQAGSLLGDVALPLSAPSQAHRLATLDVATR